jgi:hypothetical protein
MSTGLSPVACLILFLLLPSLMSNHGWGAGQFGEGCYYFLGDYPAEANPGWHVEAQGLAHDRDHWFITQKDRIWKIPVGHDLASDAGGFPSLALEDVAHFGDPECYEFEGQYYLVVPLTGEDVLSAIAVFRGDSLAYVDHDIVPVTTAGAWCAVDQSGYVYTGKSDVSAVQIHPVNWKRVADLGDLELGPPVEIPLLNELGDSLTLRHWQGGCLTPSDTLLYVVTGITDGPEEEDGIHVFEAATGRRVQRSTLGYGPFNFEWHPEGLIDEEPEGITFWDLDDGRAPGISGQLHVLLLDNDGGGPDPDDIYLKHYAGTLHVDHLHGGVEIGSLREPFNTVNEANARIWDGARINIRSGSYPEPVTFSKRLEVLASGGSVTIGR